MFSNKIFLALHAMLYLAYHASRRAPIQAKAITAQYGLKPRALEPVLLQLARRGLVQSVQGQQGGYYIANGHAVSLRDIVECFLQAPLPSDASFADLQPCVQAHLMPAYDALLAALGEQSLHALCQNLRDAGMVSKGELLLDYTI